MDYNGFLNGKRDYFSLSWIFGLLLGFTWLVIVVNHCS